MFTKTWQELPDVSRPFVTLARETRGGDGGDMVVVVVVVVVMVEVVMVEVVMVIW